MEGASSEDGDLLLMEELAPVLFDQLRFIRGHGRGIFRVSCIHCGLMLGHEGKGVGSILLCAGGEVVPINVSDVSVRNCLGVGSHGYDNAC